MGAARPWRISVTENFPLEEEISMTHLLCQGFSTTKYQHFKVLAGSEETKNNLLPY